MGGAKAEACLIIIPVSLSFTGAYIEDIGFSACNIYLGDRGPGGGEVGVGSRGARIGEAPPTGFSGCFVLISHSPLGSGRLGPLPGKNAFHSCCMYQISPPKPTGDRGDREQTNISEKANKPETPKQRLSQFSAETWIKQVTWPTTFLQSLGDFSHGNLFRQLCNFDFQLIRFVLFGRLG